jgi:hypothetical protein
LNNTRAKQVRGPDTLKTRTHARAERHQGTRIFCFSSTCAHINWFNFKKNCTSVVLKFQSYEIADAYIRSENTDCWPTVRRNSSNYSTGACWLDNSQLSRSIVVSSIKAHLTCKQNTNSLTSSHTQPWKIPSLSWENDLCKIKPRLGSNKIHISTHFSFSALILWC